MRFCLLHHTGWLGHADHYDLMLQIRIGDSDDDLVLKTWASVGSGSPIGDFDGTTFVQRADHKKLYFRYEGAVSGSRGSVKRVDEGTLFWLPKRTENNGQDVEFSAHGCILLGSYVLQKQINTHFILRKVAQFSK